MKYFFSEEARILDTILDNVTLIPGEKLLGMRVPLYPHCQEETQTQIRGILNEIYNKGVEDGKKVITNGCVCSWCVVDFEQKHDHPVLCNQCAKGMDSHQLSSLGLRRATHKEKNHEN